MSEPEQIVVALFLDQSQFVRSLLYDFIKNSSDKEQIEFAETIADQFEQAEGES